MQNKKQKKKRPRGTSEEPEQHDSGSTGQSSLWLDGRGTRPGRQRFCSTAACCNMPQCTDIPTYNAYLSLPCAVGAEDQTGTQLGPVKKGKYENPFDKPRRKKVVNMLSCARYRRDHVVPDKLFLAQGRRLDRLDEALKNARLNKYKAEQESEDAAEQGRIAVQACREAEDRRDTCKSDLDKAQHSWRQACLARLRPAGNVCITCTTTIITTTPSS